MAMEGMDVDAVKSAASQLRSHATELERISATVNAVVAQLATDWDGPDARDFESLWNQQYRPRLGAAAEAVGGLGQSALHNAAAQRDASAGGAAATGSTGGGDAPSSNGDFTVPGPKGPVDVPKTILGIDPFPLV